MLIQHLQKIFTEKARKNARYSLRAFARSMDIDSSTMSALMSGKRPLTSRMAKKILSQAEFRDSHLKEEVWIQLLNGGTQAENEYYELSNMEIEFVSSWEHFAILALLEIPDFYSTSKNISNRLNIPIAVANDSLERMKRLGFVKKSDGIWVLTKKNIATTSDIPSGNLRMAHRQHIEKASESLEMYGVDERDITGITMSIDRSKLPEAKKLIKDFRRKLSKFLETGKKTSVYRLNVQLFPLSKEDKI